MDWFKIAQSDWGFYRDTTRIKQYIQKGKITEIQCEEITGESYSV